MPTPPPFLLGFGPEVPDHGRQRRPKEILLDLVEGEKLGFHPMCLYSKYSFSIPPLCRGMSEMGHTLVGKAVPLQLEGPGFKPHWGQYAEL